MTTVRPHSPLRVVLLYIALIGGVIADQITGFLLASSSISPASLLTPSQVCRAGILVLIFISYVSGPITPGAKLIYSALALLTSLELFAFLRSGDLKAYIFGSVMTAKLIALPLFYLFFCDRFSGVENKKAFDNCLTVTCVFCAICLIGTELLGLGVATYGYGEGFKGFFPAGNGLGLALGLLFIWVCASSESRGSSAQIMLMALVGYALVGVGSKTSLVLAIAGAAIWFFGSSDRVGKWLWLIPMAAVMALAQFWTQFDVVISRFESSPDLFSFIASGRDLHLLESIAVSTQSYQLIDGLFGKGAFYSFREFTSDPIIFDTLEQDLTDLFFFYGVFGVVYHTIVFALLFIGSPIFSYRSLVVMLLYGHSVLAGHVLQNGFVALVSAAVLFSLLRGSSREAGKRPLKQACSQGTLGH